jgi:hypothetical protein
LAELDDDYAEIVSAAKTPRAIYVTLRISAQNLDMDRISALLQLTPTLVQRAGESSKLIGLVIKEDCWSYSTKDINSQHLAVHLASLLNKLNSKTSALSTLRSEGYELAVSCYWLAPYDNVEIHLNHLLMKKLSEFELSIWFDVYTGAAGE